MDIIEILDDKLLKAIDKRKAIAQGICEGTITISQIEANTKIINPKKLPIVFEAIEAVTNSEPQKADIHWLNYATANILSEHNTIKREASRIVGNIAHCFPHDLDKSVGALLQNTTHESKVVRWGSAYAYAKIIVLPEYANSELFNQLTKICDEELENGVKNQYVKALKRAVKNR